MYKLFIVITLVSILILFSGCSGDMLSPSNYQTATHTTTITTTRTNTAEQSQDANTSTCTGLIVLNSCNNTQASAQSTEAKAIVPTPTQVEPTTSVFEGIIGYILMAIGCLFWFCLMVWQLSKVFSHESSC